MDESPLDQADGDLTDYDEYSKTPPRTKILRKNRERKSKKESSISVMSTEKSVEKKHCFLSRRNTVSTMFDDLLAKSENIDLDQGSKRLNKRNLKLLRGSERDLKLDIASAQAAAFSDKISVKDNLNLKTPQPSFPIESCKRFMSLSCRTVPCLKQKNIKLATHDKSQEIIDECPKSRVEFYQTLSLLIRMGCGERQTQERNTKRGITKEEQLWQNEVKDLIWLELQAFHADRTPIEEDTYLCLARENVLQLLKDIMSYRFQRNSKCSTQNSDSGVEDDCLGCLSMYCQSCIEAQNEALKDVEDLMRRLEAAEALFPSSKAFAELYPLYQSPEFVGRVKAISLWYNMTKHQRLKLLILGKLMALLENKYCQWPLLMSGSSSPSDSNSSSSSVNDYLNNSKIGLDFYNITPITVLANRKPNNISPYRKYIENILKTRTLHKSLSFLDNLHFYVLRKAQFTLEKPDCYDIFKKTDIESEEEELQRYGCWSPEANALNLPSYRASFLFLAAVPLEVIHEFLIMRLEQKPEKPSPLSIRQLMRELKDGLKIATMQKAKILKYIDSAVSGTKESGSTYKNKLKDYDLCMAKVFSDYLDYLEQWALLYHEWFQRNLLEVEWQFSCEIIEYIPGGSDILGRKFCLILFSIMKSIEDGLKNRIEELLTVLHNEDNMNKQFLFTMCRELQSLFNEKRELAIKTVAFCKIVFKHELPEKSEAMLKSAIISLKCSIPEAIARIQVMFDQITNLTTLDELDKLSLLSRMREILMQTYKFGFEFYKELSESISSQNREKLTGSMIQFANLWMSFVTEKCERGRGVRPRWAYQGLEFLLAVCEPRNTKHLTDNEFEELKRRMDVCISHVIGTTATPTTPPDSGFHSSSPRASLDHVRIRSRGSSPSTRPTYKSQRSSASRKTSAEQSSPISDNVDGINFNSKKDDTMVKPQVIIKFPPSTPSERYLEAIEHLDQTLDEELRKQDLIGKVVTCNNNCDKRSDIRRKFVTFTWQRGIKIGQGRFGKVYTAVNNNTGEMMAVKEIPLLHNDNLTIKRVADEMKILEGILHVNLVKYYGVEVHKEEMLIFMEFCAEGTLENLVLSSENGLPELIIRRYTYQLICGVAVLHDHGIVHRDIKTANIFLTEGGNCLKIGDFGCAAKIKSHTTMPGELQGFVGTQAYMAPEVFTKNMSEGHGRGADIWSIGCVVVEMASGKRPWAQYDSNYQIMFKVGMGQSPDPPDHMTDEGLDFLDSCFQHDPKERATVYELLEHNFVKVGDD